MNAIVAIITVIVAIILFTSIAYVKAPPNRAAIITGLLKEPRILRGKAGFKIPFFERVDWLEVGQMDISVETEEFIPTSDFINIQVDAIAQVSIDVENGMDIAMRNFLNKNMDEIKTSIAKTLQGNLREIIGTMELKNICQNKAEFSKQVKENAEEDIANLGISIISFNVQNIKDKENLISDLGIDNREKIRKSASIAKADSLKEVSINQAKADNESNTAEIESQTEIAKRENELAIKRAELKTEEDKAKARADATYDIESQRVRKDLEKATQEAEIAKREKEIELQAKEAEVTEKKLDAEIKKKADADRYAEEMKAEAELFKRKKEAEADLFEKEKEAEAIKKKGEAEADAIRMKGIAEAEAMHKKAEAMKKYGEAAILEMLIGVLPDIAKAVAEPISSISDVKIIGSGSQGVSDISGNVPIVMAQVMETVKEATGVDLQDIIHANTYDAKVNRKVEITGSVPIKEQLVGTADPKENADSK